MQTMGMLDLGGGSTQITFLSSDKVRLLLMAVVVVLTPWLTRRSGFSAAN